MKRFASILETVPQPCRIFGTALRPFCLGHHVLFHRLNLPFAGSHSADATKEQFMQAVVICAGESYEATLNAFLDGTWVQIYEAWQKRVKRQADNNSKMFSAIKSFRQHLKDGYRKPPIWSYDGTGGITLSAPWEEILKCQLISGGFSISDVMNGYLPERRYDYFTMSEIRQAAVCMDAKKFKPVFYTFEDANLDSKSEVEP